MISAIGNRGNRDPARQAGFSLIEILLVLALMAVAGSIVIFNFAAYADRGDELSAEESLSAAIRKARYLAAKERQIVSLSFDKENGQLLVQGERSEDANFPLHKSFNKDGNADIRFYTFMSSEGPNKATGPKATETETQIVIFAPDRSSSPFVVAIDSGFGSPERHRFDPFSSLRRAEAE